MGSDAIRVVHIGAGNHSQEKSSQYKKLIKQALSARNIKDASAILELSPLTNTGYGSSLNLLGKVSCDASFISVHQDEVLMGGMNNISHQTPAREMIKAYDNLKRVYDETLSKYGITWPLLLDYSDPGFRDLVQLGDPKSELKIAPRSRKVHDMYKDKLLNQETEADVAEAFEVGDTIGVMHFDSDSKNIVTSSGGNFFKIPGRIGCAAILGAAIDYRTKGPIEVSCMCSGNGEEIIRASLAREVARKMIDSIDHDGDVLVNAVTTAKLNPENSGLLEHGGKTSYVGVVCLVNNLETNDRRLIYCHSTESFFFGIRVGDWQETVLSRLSTSANVGHVFARGEYKL